MSQPNRPHCRLALARAIACAVWFVPAWTGSAQEPPPSSVAAADDLTRLADRKASVRIAAVRQLQGSRDARATDALIAAAKSDKDRDVRIAALRALGARDDDRAADLLTITAKQDRNENIRAAAEFGLLRRDLRRARVAVWQVHSAVLFDEAYIGSPLGIAGTLDMSSRLTRAILGRRAEPFAMMLVGEVPIHSLVRSGFTVRLAPVLEQPLIEAGSPERELPAGTTRSYRLAQSYFQNAAIRLEDAAVDRAREDANVSFLLGLSAVPVARLERVVNRQSGLTTDRWAGNTDIHARLQRVSDSKAVWKSTASCRVAAEGQNPSSTVLDKALAEAAACAIKKLGDIVGALIGSVPGGEQAQR